MRRQRGANRSSVSRKHCKAAPARSTVAVNSNTSSPYRPSPAFIVLDDTTTSLASTAPEIQVGASAFAYPSRVVIEEDAKPMSALNMQSIASPDPTSTSSTFQITSSTSSPSPSTPNISSTSSTVTMRSRKTATPPPTSFNLVTSTSTSTRQATVVQINPQLFSPSPSSPSTLSNDALPTNELETIIPEFNNSPSDTRKSQQPTGSTSPLLRPPAEQIQRPTQQARISRPTAQEAPSNQPPGQDEAIASNPGSLDASTRMPAVLTSSVAVSGIADDPPSIGVIAPALPTTLESPPQDSSSRSRETREEQTATAFLPNETTSLPFLGGPPPGSTPVGDLNKPSGDTRPSVDEGDMNPESGSHHPSTGAIIGISIAGVIGLAIMVILIWFVRRRSKKQAEPISSPNSGGSHAERSRGKAAFLSLAGNWLSNATQTETAPDSASGDFGHHAVTGMAERRVRLGFESAPFRLAPSKQQNTQPTSSRQRYGAMTRDEENQRVVGPSQSQASLPNPFSDRHAIGAPPRVPSLPPTVLLFNAPTRNQNSREFNTVPSRPSPLRGRSLSATERTSQCAPVGGGPARPRSVHRESLQSVDSFSNKRDKFRSDPFDLEIESCLISSEISASGLPQQTGPNSTYGTRSVSNSSRYTSGMSMSDWSLLQENRPTWSMPASPSSKKRIVSWDSPQLTDAVKPTDATRRPTAAGQPNVVFGQAL